MYISLVCRFTVTFVGRIYKRGRMSVPGTPQI